MKIIMLQRILEKWIVRSDNVEVNALAALQAVEAKGFYRAIKCLAEKEAAGKNPAAIPLNVISIGVIFHPEFFVFLQRLPECGAVLQENLLLRYPAAPELLHRLQSRLKAGL